MNDRARYRNYHVKIMNLVESHTLKYKHNFDKSNQVVKRE